MPKRSCSALRIVARRYPASGPAGTLQPVDPCLRFSTACKRNPRQLAFEQIKVRSQGIEAFEFVQNPQRQYGPREPINLAVDAVSIIPTFHGPGIFPKIIELPADMPGCNEPRAQPLQQRVRAKSLAQNAVNK